MTTFTRQQRMESDYALYQAWGGKATFEQWVERYGDDYSEDEEVKP